MSKVPFYFSEELAAEARTALFDILNSLGPPEPMGDPCAQLPQEEKIECYCGGLEGFGLDLCMLEHQYNVTLDPAIQNTGDARRIVTEILEAIKQLSQVLCEHSGVECNEAVEALLFRELFANYENGLIFQACPSLGCPDLTGAATLTAAESGIIFLSNGGRGMAARVEEAELVTRYLITHELLHILSFRTGLVESPTSSSGALWNAYYRGQAASEENGYILPLVGNLTKIMYPFYDDQDYLVNVPDSNLPQGLNNFGNIDVSNLLLQLDNDNISPEDRVILFQQLEETGVELLNLFVWRGVVNPANPSTSFGFRDPDAEDFASQEIANPDEREEVRLALQALIALIETSIPGWIEAARDSQVERDSDNDVQE